MQQSQSESQILYLSPIMHVNGPAVESLYRSHLSAGNTYLYVLYFQIYLSEAFYVVIAGRQLYLSLIIKSYMPDLYMLTKGN